MHYICNFILTLYKKLSIKIYFLRFVPRFVISSSISINILIQLTLKEKEKEKEKHPVNKSAFALVKEYGYIYYIKFFRE